MINDYNIMTMNSKLHSLMLLHTYLPIMLCKKISVPVKNWLDLQATSPNAIPVPDLCNVFTKILSEDSSWEPDLTPGFMVKLGLPASSSDWNRMGGRRVEGGGDAGGIGGLGSNSGSNDPQGDSGASNPGRVNNTKYNPELFDEFKKDGVPSRVVKNKIRAAELQALPQESKVDGQDLCLGWHVW